MPDFLLEIGTEELPAGYISRQQLDTFSDTFSQLLTKETLEYQSIKATATPRRIVFKMMSGGVIGNALGC